MTLDEAIAKIDCPQVDGLPMVRCETGDRYESVVSGGIQPEGCRSPLLAATEEIAVKYWLSAFNEYASDKTGMLYWRERPQMNSWVIVEAEDTERRFGYRVYSVYSRLVISDKPVLPKDDPLGAAHYERLAEKAAT